MVVQINGANLPDGWAQVTSRVEHLIEVNGYNPTDANQGSIRFFDSANPNEDGGSIVPGFYNMPIGDLVRNLGLYDDIW